MRKQGRERKADQRETRDRGEGGRWNQESPEEGGWGERECREKDETKERRQEMWDRSEFMEGERGGRRMKSETESLQRDKMGETSEVIKKRKIREERAGEGRVDEREMRDV